MDKRKLKLTGGTVLVTGAAGFIGSNLSKRLLDAGEGLKVIGLDNMSDYYDPGLKRRRLAEIESLAGGNWSFARVSLADRDSLEKLFVDNDISVVVNLAAQAGVRYSIVNPEAYIESNVTGFFNLLECCRRHPVEHLVFASSSSVYGANSKVPYSVEDRTDSPVSLYAATKKSDELLAYAYSKLYDIPCTGLRFFTVYGPFGRPDMAYYKFADRLAAGEVIDIFNYGKCERDFTYVDDVVEGLFRVIGLAPVRRSGVDGLPEAPYSIYNIGSHKPYRLMEFIDILQQELVSAGVLPEDFDFESHRRLVPMQAGDVVATYADMSGFERDFGPLPVTPLRDGLRAFARWYAADSFHPVGVGDLSGKGDDL